MNVVIASFAQDEVFDTQSGVREIRSGGPAHWINVCFNRINASLVVHTADTPAVVSISVSDGEETGVILRVLPILSLPQNCRVASLIIVSTISDEYDVYDLEGTTGICALDVQGYVRSGFFTKPAAEISSVCQLFRVVKMTESEMQKIPGQIVEEFKKQVCIVTKGAKGFSLFEHGKETSFAATKIFAKDTIGAGDTLFAAFCYEYSKSHNATNAALFAKTQVELFLNSK